MEIVIARKSWIRGNLSVSRWIEVFLPKQRELAEAVFEAKLGLLQQQLILLKLLRKEDLVFHVVQRTRGVK